MASLSDQIVLKTKISLPAVKENLVIRERLILSVTNGINGRLTTVCAPAGFGKSVLISQWVHQSGVSSAWVSLDEADNDLMRFWRYINRAFAAALPAQIADPLDRLVPLLPSLTVATFIDALINELFAYSERLVLVLDDYHKIKDQRIHESLAYFIEYLPDHVHVIVASRAGIPFSTSKWMARGELNEIGIVQLQFTVEETGAFYQHTASLPLAAGQIEKLFRQTEGWITGLQLLSISLRPQSNYDSYIDQINGYQRNIAEYLFQEVLTGLPAEVYSFLLQTSVLERMDAELCDAVTGKTDGRDILGKLQALNLFVIPLDDHNRWFRYHHLFSEFLRSLVKRNHPEQWLESNRSAAKHLGSRGLMDQAIDHAVIGGLYEDAADLLGLYAADVLKRGEFSTLLQWLEVIAPNAALSSNMQLLHAFIFVVTGQSDRAAGLLDRIEAHSLNIQNTEEREQIQSGILFVKSNLFFYSGNYGQWYAYAEEKLNGILPENPVFYNFNYNMTEPLVRRTAFGLKGALSPDTETIALRFISVLETHGWTDSLINLYVVQSLCEGYYEWNRLEKCADLIYKMERSGRFEQIAGLLVPNRITQARIHIANGNYRAAHETIDETLEAVNRLAEYYWLNPLRAFRVRLYLLEGYTAKAKKELAGLRLSLGGRPASNRMFEYMTFVRLLGAQGKEAEALRLLEQLKQQALREQCLVSMAEVACLQALLELQRGQRSAALSHLHTALAIGEPNGYIRTFLDEGKPMFKLLQTYVYERNLDAGTGEWQGVSGDYIQKLLGLFPQNEQQPEAAASVLVEPLSNQELFILSLLKQGASNRQIAETSALTEGTVKVYLSRIYAKLNVSSRTQALAAAEEMQLLGEG